MKRRSLIRYISYELSLLIEKEVEKTGLSFVKASEKLAKQIKNGK